MRRRGAVSGEAASATRPSRDSALGKVLSDPDQGFQSHPLPTEWKGPSRYESEVRSDIPWSGGAAEAAAKHGLSSSKITSCHGADRRAFGMSARPSPPSLLATEMAARPPSPARTCPPCASSRTHVRAMLVPPRVNSFVDHVVQMLTSASTSLWESAHELNSVLQSAGGVARQSNPNICLA